MAYHVLLKHVPVPANPILVMRIDIEPAEAAKEYEYLIKVTFEAQDHTLDLVLLAMGNDGHTLSLLPGVAVVHEQEAWVKAFPLESREPGLYYAESKGISMAFNQENSCF